LDHGRLLVGVPGFAGAEHVQLCHAQERDALDGDLVAGAEVVFMVGEKLHFFPALFGFAFHQLEPAFPQTVYPRLVFGVDHALAGEESAGTVGSQTDFQRAEGLIRKAKSLVRISFGHGVAFAGVGGSGFFFAFGASLVSVFVLVFIPVVVMLLVGMGCLRVFLGPSPLGPGKTGGKEK
jgi:hypothetical protein